MSGADDTGRAKALVAEGEEARQRGKYSLARERFEQALALLRADPRRDEELADCLDCLGDVLLSQGDHAGAQRHYEEALTLHSSIDGQGTISSARSLNGLGKAAYSRGDLVAARDFFEKTLSIRRRALGEEHPDVAGSLNNLGNLNQAIGDLAAARTLHEQALAIRRRTLGEEHPDVALSLNNLGNIFKAMGDYAAARSFHEQALAIRRRALGEEHPDVATSLNNLGNVSHAIGDYVAARTFHEQTLAIWRRTLGDEDPHVAAILNSLGVLSGKIGDYAAARTFLEQALAIRRRTLGEEHPDVAASINNLGLLSDHMGDYAAARTFHEQALAIRRRTLGEEHPNVAASLNNLGMLFKATGDYAAARTFYEQALAILRRTLGEEHPDVATSLNNLGVVLEEIGAYAAARGFHEQALAIRRRALGEEHPDVATSLDNVGILFKNMDDYAAARTFYEQALAIRRRTLGEEHPEVASSLYNLGELSHQIGERLRARQHFEQALAIWIQSLGDLHPDVTYALLGLAKLSLSEDALDEAASCLGEALRIALLPDNRVHLPETYRQLSKLKVAEGARDAAIFFGKQTVNAIQGQRGRLTGLDPDLQRSFLATKEKAYRELADLLVEDGRLGEAQQVLAMLKEEELFDLLRRDAASDPRLTFAELTRLEAEWRRHGDEVSADLVRLTEEVAALRKKSERSEAEEERLRAARAEFDAAGRAFRAWLDTLRGELATSAAHDAHSADINLGLLERLQGDLRALGPGAALVSYIVGDERLSIILTTPSLQVSREADLPARTVNRLVHEFRLALDQKLDETTELGQALWRHLIGPIAPLLEEARIETLMVVPYGTLRYLPLAALHDSKAYLVERFAVAVLTLAAHGSLRDTPQSDWRVAGFGVSREVPGYRRLQAVTQELRGIIKTEAEESGVYPGVIRLDERFTEDSFADALEAHQAVHVASHFMLNPARGLNSHLLLGDGGTLSLERLRDPRFDFHDVELMTLSACETAMGGAKEDGREFEGFAALVQQRGARAVIASLWPVADESTAPFMTAFYRARREGLTKAAALRAAQLALLQGGHAHPYHWAPFVLMGNWL